jgi:hypothetical protein
MNDNSISGCGMFLAVCAAIIVVVGMFGANALSDWQQARVDEQYARAAAVEAQGRADALRIEARTEQQAQRQANWEHSFMMWTTATALIVHDPTAWLALLLLLGIGAGGWWLVREWRLK